jgi:hypothetical protein
MLFGPKRGEQFGDPDVDGSQAVEAGVAGCADSDEQVLVAFAGPSVVNVKAIPCPAAGAPTKMITGEDGFLVPSEVIPRVPAHPIALRAKPGDSGRPFAAGAKQRLFRERVFRRARGRRFRL